MIKNRTSEFKRKYASTDKQTLARHLTPDYLKKIFAQTGFTDLTVSTSAKKTISKKLAKVQSSAFIKTKSKVSQFSQPNQIFTTKNFDNSTSLCRYLEYKKIHIEKKANKNFEMSPHQDTEPQKATIQPKFFKQKVKNQSQRNFFVIKELSDIEGFFQGLTPRSLFFCCKCFKYVFAIQKNLHYPQCDNKVNLISMNQKQKGNLGWERLQLILQLSQYTNFKQQQLKDLHKKLKEKDYQHFQNIVIGMNVSFLGFQSILQAFAFIYEILIKDSNNQFSGIFNIKKIFGCVQPRLEPYLV